MVVKTWPQMVYIHNLVKEIKPQGGNKTIWCFIYNPCYRDILEFCRDFYFTCNRQLEMFPATTRRDRKPLTCPATSEKRVTSLYHFQKIKEQHLALTFNNHMGINPPKRKEGYQIQSHVAFDWRTLYAAVAKYPMQEKASRLHQSGECAAFIIRDAQILAVIGVGPAVLHCQASAH